MEEINKILVRLKRIKNKNARKILYDYIMTQKVKVKPKTLNNIRQGLTIFFSCYNEDEPIIVTEQKVLCFLMTLSKCKKISAWQYAGVVKRFLEKNRDLIQGDWEKIKDMLKIHITKDDTLRVKHKSQLPTMKEIKKMIDYANTRDRAIITLLFETGIRVGELVKIKLKDVHFEERYVKIDINESKTKPRTVYIIQTLPYLKDWLLIHPQKDDPEAFLFVSRSGKQMSPIHVDMELYYISQKVTGKKYSAHLFRHLRTTILMTKKFPTVQLNKLLGWSKDSNMPTRYTHLIDKDVEDAVLDFYGIKPIRREDGEEILLTNCPRCGNKNPIGAVYCSQCGFVLKAEKIEDAKKAEDMKMRILRIIAEDEELLDLIAKKLAA